MHIAIEELAGKPIIDITGRALGRLERALVDGESWAIEVVRVKLRRAVAEELGLAPKWYRASRIDIPTGLILGVRDAIVVRAALDELHGLVPDHVVDEPSPLARWLDGLSRGRRAQHA
jgi:sporulation protein YlmC with PRC-barrel domain